MTQTDLNPPAPAYRPLARSPGLGRLWLGDDHLLLQTWQGFSEDNARFYLRDIQALVAHRTGDGKVVNAIYVTLLLGSFLFIGLSRWLTSPGIVIFAALLVLSIAGGPTCHFYVRTAVNQRRLPAVGRMRQARRVMRELAPLIQQAQGPMDDDELRRRLAEVAATQAPPHLAAVPPVRAGVPAPGMAAAAPAQPRMYMGGAHLLLSLALLATSVMAAAAMAVEQAAVGVVLGLTAVLLLGAWAASQQRQSPVPRGMRRTPWMALLLLAVLFALGVLAIILVVEADFTLGNLPWLIILGGALPLGVVGLVQYVRFRRQPAAEAQSAPVQAAADQQPLQPTEGQGPQ